MSALLILLIAVVALALGYVFYGSWLAKQWGVDPNRETPAHTAYDGKDFVPANPAVLMGHHFSSIAGAGPINGPIQAAVFGWVPVFLWCVLGGIFFGAMHDFGALFASIRHNGGSIGQVMKDSMGIKAQRLFIVFALAVLILVIASFTAVVAGTFVSVDPAAPTYAANGSTAMTSILFIVIAAIFGFFVYRKNAKIGPATVIGIIGIVLIVVLGQFIGLHFSRTFWVLFIAVYVTVASLLPVWILLQPRDYLSSFLLYGMMIIAVISIVGATFTGAATVEAPAFYGWKNPAGQPLFPFLFITVACGACSGFHSLISSGTSSKQIDNEKDAQIIGYGSMIVESALGVISLIAIGVVWSQTSAGGGDKFQLSAPPTIFAGGIATMFASFAGEKSYAVIYNLFTLAVSVFALTSLDSATRLCRYLFAELLTPEGKTHEDLTGAANGSVPDLERVRRCQPAARLHRDAGCLHLARQDRPQQQDVLLPDGLHALRDHHRSLLHYRQRLQDHSCRRSVGHLLPGYLEHRPGRSGDRPRRHGVQDARRSGQGQEGLSFTLKLLRNQT